MRCAFCSIFLRRKLVVYCYLNRQISEKLDYKVRTVKLENKSSSFISLLKYHRYNLNKEVINSIFQRSNFLEKLSRANTPAEKSIFHYDPAVIFCQKNYKKEDMYTSSENFYVRQYFAKLGRTLVGRHASRFYSKLSLFSTKRQRINPPTPLFSDLF